MKLLMENWDKHLFELAPAGNAAAQADRERRVLLHSHKQLISEASKEEMLAAAEKEIEQLKKQDPENAALYDKKLQKMKMKAAKKQNKQQNKQQLKQQAQQKQQAAAQTTQKPASKSADRPEGCPPGAKFSGVTGEPCTPEAAAKAKEEAPTVKGGPGAAAQQAQKAQQSNPKAQRLQKFYDKFQKDPKAAQTFVLQRIKKQMDSLK